MYDLSATYTENDRGIWSVNCADCPLKTHAVALGQLAPDCVSGIVTNMQGPVILRQCSHADDLRNESAGLVILCGYALAGGGA